MGLSRDMSKSTSVAAAFMVSTYRLVKLPVCAVQSSDGASALHLRFDLTHSRRRLFCTEKGNTLNCRERNEEAGKILKLQSDWQV